MPTLQGGELLQKRPANFSKMIDQALHYYFINEKNEFKEMMGPCSG